MALLVFYTRFTIPLIFFGHFHKDFYSFFVACIYNIYIYTCVCVRAHVCFISFHLVPAKKDIVVFCHFDVVLCKEEEYLVYNGGKKRVFHTDNNVTFYFFIREDVLVKVGWPL